MAEALQADAAHNTNDAEQLRIRGISHKMAQMRQAHSTCAHLAAAADGHAALQTSVYNAADVLNRRIKQPLPTHPALRNLNSYFAKIHNADVKELLRTRVSLLFKEAKHRGNQGRFVFAQAAKIVAGAEGIEYGERMLLRLQRCGIGRKNNNFGKPIFDVHIYRHWAVAPAVTARKQQVNADAAVRNRRARADQQALKTPPPSVSQVPEIKQVLEPIREVVNFTTKTDANPTSKGPAQAQPQPRAQPPKMPMASIADILLANPTPPAAPANKVTVKVDYVNEEEDKTSLLSEFERRAAMQIAKGKNDDARQRRIAEQDAWEAAAAKRQQTRLHPKPKLAGQGDAKPKHCAQFVAPSDDAQIADSVWLHQNVSSSPALRLLHLSKTGSKQYSRSQVRAAAACVVASLPSFADSPLAIFVNALKQIKAGTFVDPRLRGDIRLAKHGWDERLYALAGRWPLATAAS